MKEGSRKPVSHNRIKRSASAWVLWKWLKREVVSGFQIRSSQVDGRGRCARRKELHGPQAGGWCRKRAWEHPAARVNLHLQWPGGVKWSWAGEEQRLRMNLRDNIGGGLCKMELPKRVGRPLMGSRAQRNEVRNYSLVWIQLQRADLLHLCLVCKAQTSQRVPGVSVGTTSSAPWGSACREKPEAQTHTHHLFGLREATSGLSQMWFLWPLQSVPKGYLPLSVGFLRIDMK